MKKCKKCGVIKEFDSFNKRTDSKDGYRNECKDCRRNKENESIRNKKYYLENRLYLLNKANERKYKQRNLDGKIIKIKEISKHLAEGEKICSKCYVIFDCSYFTTDRTKKDGLSSQCNFCRNKYFSERKKNDIVFKISSYLRSSLSQSVSKNKLVKVYKTLDILGCPIEEFKKFIECKFKEGMNWDNYGIWHLDHIIPISYAVNENDLYRLSHFSNFQPMWGIDNLKKGNRYVG